MKLFCLPHAGGSASFYTKWTKKIENSFVELVCIEYKGHGVRMDEGFYNSFYDMVEDVYDIVSKKIMDKSDKYMIFGHSMGACVAYELECLLEQRRNLYCSHIFLSGREAPIFWGKDDEVRSDLPDEQFLGEILKFGGVESSCFDDKEVLDLFLPIMRNDFRLVESINKTKGYPPIKAHMTIMNGSTDKDCELKQVDDWRNSTYLNCEILYYDGGHFYINDHTDEICDYICRCSKNDNSK